MASPGNKRRPQSTSEYEPLLQSSSEKSANEKPKPPPKPNKPRSSSITATVAGGYFQPGGNGSSIGYCLSSVYKAKVGPRTSTDDCKINDDNLTTKSHKPKFGIQDGSRPQIASLPTKFRVSFEERNKQIAEAKSDIDSETSNVLVPITEPLSQSVRRPPPPVPTSCGSQMSDPSHTSSNKISEVVPAKHPSLERRHTSPIVSTSPTPIITDSALKEVRPVVFAQPPPRELEYIEREHPKYAFTNFEKFREKGELCDVVLVADDKEFKAHRVVLAASSEYFESMFVGEFAEPLGEPIIIEEVSADALEAIINFAYTFQIKLTERNVYSLFDAAELLQFNGIKGACFKFFKQQINKSNCIRTWLFAESHNCTELIDASLKYIECNFLDIVRGKEFLDLDQQEVVFDIASREDLAVTSEEQVYEAVLAWIQNQFEKRKKYALEVLKSVRFSNMSKDYLMYIVDHEPLIKEDPDLLQLLIDALQSHVTTARGTLKKKSKKEGGSSMNMMPRAASMAVEVVDVYRCNELLGLRIMGGFDRPQHVFRQGDKPGIFILKILEGGAAEKIGKLRAGDRILKVNDRDMTRVAHEEAIQILKTSYDPLSFLVRHEPPPVGLLELTLVAKPGEGFGFVVAGGVNSYCGNPLDDTDEGIFVSQIIPGGAAEQDGRIKVGTRIIQVNSISMWGKTHEEALKVLQGVLDRMNLLVCDGYDPDAVDQTVDSEGFV